MTWESTSASSINIYIYTMCIAYTYSMYVYGIKKCNLIIRGHFNETNNNKQ